MLDIFHWSGTFAFFKGRLNSSVSIGEIDRAVSRSIRLDTPSGLAAVSSLYEDSRSSTSSWEQLMFESRGPDLLVWGWGWVVSAHRGIVEQVKQNLKNWLRIFALWMEVEAVWELYLRSVVYVAFWETVCGRIPRSHGVNGWQWIDFQSTGLWQL